MQALEKLADVRRPKIKWLSAAEGKDSFSRAQGCARKAAVGGAEPGMAEGGFSCA